MTKSERIADKLAAIIGSWKFIITQSIVLFAWIVSNVMGWVNWDEYPFILLNLLLSFQAAYTGPVLLMSANRQSAVDRRRAMKNLTIDMQDHDLIIAMQLHLDKHFDMLMGELKNGGRKQED